jgi:hypothetical protein
VNTHAYARRLARAPQLDNYEITGNDKHHSLQVRSAQPENLRFYENFHAGHAFPASLQTDTPALPEFIQELNDQQMLFLMSLPPDELRGWFTGQSIAPTRGEWLILLAYGGAAVLGILALAVYHL